MPLQAVTVSGEFKEDLESTMECFLRVLLKSHIGNEHQFLDTFLFKSSSIPLSKMKYATTCVIFFSVVHNTWKMKYKAPILFM